jgi:hypothetical protein
MTPAEKGYSKERSCRRSARVAIAGGGIGGMALALALHDAGFRDVDVSVQWVVGNPTQARFKLFISRMLHRNVRLTAAAISAPADGSADFACQALINRRPGDNLHLQIPLTIGVFQILM